MWSASLGRPNNIVSTSHRHPVQDDPFKWLPSSTLQRQRGNLGSQSWGHPLHLDAKTAHEEALHFVWPSHSLKLLHFVCVRVQRGTFFFCQCVLTSRCIIGDIPERSQCCSGGRDRVSVRMFPWRFGFATMMHLYEEKLSRHCAQACGCTQYYVRCVLSPKSLASFLCGSYIGKSSPGLLPAVRASCWVLDGGLASWEFLLRRARSCWLHACEEEEGLRVVANEEGAILCQKRQPRRGLVYRSWSDCRRQ